MIIIVEGADGAGKTTLVDHLVSSIHERRLDKNLRLYHAGPLDADPLDAYLEPLQDYVPQTTGDIRIMDRWHVGELVYGPLLRGGSRINTATWRYLELFLASRGALTVHLDQPNEVIHQRVTEAGDSLVTPDLAVQAAEAYRALPGAWCHSNRRMDMLPSDHVFTKAFTRSLVAARLASFPTYIGPPNPQALLMCNEFFITDFILQLLPERKWRHTGVVNGCDVDVQQLWSKLSQPEVVALGHDAHWQLHVADVPHETVDPPYIISKDQAAQERYAQTVCERAGYG